MDMRIETALKRRDRLVSALRDIYSMAHCFGLASVDLHSRCQDAYKTYCDKAPGWVREYADGYRRALMDAAYRHELVFGGFIEGKFYSTHRDRADYYEKNGIEPSAYADDGKVTQRGHYWTKSVDAGKPAPFFIA
jgi:hypothetical protein